MGSAKAAMESAVRYFAVALAKRGITVNSVSPGFTEDSVLNSLPPQGQEMIRTWHREGWTPMGRLGTPADIGGMVALLGRGWLDDRAVANSGWWLFLNESRVASGASDWLRDRYDRHRPSAETVVRFKSAYRPSINHLAVKNCKM
jgi:hypothetical protein